MPGLESSARVSDTGASSNASEQPIPSTDTTVDLTFRCNICFESPVDAVVTRCGHLYCWSCLHAWLERGAVQCPVCKAGVTRAGIVPVYGSGSDNRYTSKQRHPAAIDSSESAKRDAASSCENESTTRQRIPDRPRPERSEPPPTTASSTGFPSQSWGSHNIQFGLFPFGIGIQFGTGGAMAHSGFGTRSSRPLTPEQQRSQFISTMLIMLGIVVIFWSIFVDSVRRTTF